MRRRSKAEQDAPGSAGATPNKPATEWDVAALLKLMWETWNDVFRAVLGRAERNFVSELRDHRNNWAHQKPFSGDDAYRALDTTNRLLTAVSALQATEVEKLKMELLRVRYDEQARGERRKQASLAIESAAVDLKPWREVVTPHQDVASGRYQQAEFAADLQQASRGAGPAEYRDPVEFFRRTDLPGSIWLPTPRPPRGGTWLWSPTPTSRACCRFSI